MIELKKWSKRSSQTVNGHQLTFLKVETAGFSAGIAAVAKVVPIHYASKTRLANLMAKLGKASTAKFIKQKLPTTKSLRSGDLGEILASEYVTEFTKFAGVNRLRWKDHREMAMRGDDIIGVRPDPAFGVAFLKGEVKSAATLTAGTVAQARKALKASKSRPAPHALSYVSDRLHEQGNDVLGDLIDDAALSKSIQLNQVSHLMFVFTGNDPTDLLQEDLDGYTGKVSQSSVGLRVDAHQTFIRRVYKKVISDGYKP